MHTSQFIYHYRLDQENFFLLNTMTGAADVVGEELAGRLQPGVPFDDAGMEPELIQALQERGYLVDREQERRSVDLWFERFRTARQPMEFWVCPTFTCNLRCGYCFQDLAVRESKVALSEAQVERMFAAMDQVAAAQNADRVNITLSGGEPLLAAHKETVAKIAELAAARSWTLSAITNGTQLDRYLDLFQTYTGLFQQLQITLDGPPEVHDQWRVRADGKGTFAMIARNISRVLELGIRVAARVNVGPENVPGLPALFAIFEANGWTKYPHFVCQLAPVTDHMNTGCTRNYQPEYKLLEQLYALFPDWELVRERYRITLGRDLERRTRLLRKLFYRGEISERQPARGLTPCGAGNGRGLAMGADGLIYPCPETVGLEDVAVGRFDPEFSLDQSKWGKWYKHIGNAPKCTTCAIAPICGTGCTWQGICSGDLDSYEPDCNFAHETVKTYLDLNRDRLVRLFG